MKPKYQEEIAANLERAKTSIQAAKDLAVKEYYDFVASRAYYAAFYAATAVLLHEGLAFSKHSGVIAFIHKDFVKTGKLDRRHGENLNWHRFNPAWLIHRCSGIRRWRKRGPTLTRASGNRRGTRRRIARRTYAIVLTSHLSEV